MDTKSTFEIPKKPFMTGKQPVFLLQTEMFIFLVTVLAMTFLLANKFIWKPVLQENQVANINIYASHNFIYEDEEATNALVNQRINDISPSKVIDKAVSENEIKQLKELLANILDVKQSVSDDEKFSTTFISSDVQNRLFSLPQTDWDTNIYNPTLDIIARMLAGGVPAQINKISIAIAVESYSSKKINILDRRAINQIILASFIGDKNIIYVAKQSNTGNENSIKNQINALYKKYVNDYTKNTSSNKSYTKLKAEKRNETIESAIYILNKLQEIRRTKKLNNLVYNTISADVRKPVQELSYDELAQVNEIAINTFSKLLKEGITETDSKIINDRLDVFLPDNISSLQRSLIYKLINKIAKPNYTTDQKTYDEIKKEIMKEMKPVMVSVNKGKLLLKKGDLITKNNIKILDSAGLLDKNVDWDGVSAVFSLVSLLMLLFVTYLHIFERDVINSPTYLWLLCTFLIGITLCTNIFENLNPKFIPIAVFTAIISMFISRRVALISLLFISVLYFNSYDITTLNSVTLFIGSVAAALIFPKVNQRINILKSGIIIALIQVISFNVATILFDISNVSVQVSSNADIIMDSVGWLISGFSFSMVVLAVLPLVEESFGLITYSRLTELGDFNQPLLRELEEKAPGTFQHSTAVAALSEFAARKLNLDSTLTRVGSYYHDIGKMMKPAYYVENLIEVENPHDKLNDPFKSAKIIISHARAGVSIARKHKLPLAIVPFILEHHGTSLVSYFYYRALQNAKNGEEFNEEDFRYFGPKPQSKETAIVMLADSSEAAVRALKEKTKESIRNKVYDIVANKINDGQLNESGLTTDEIAVVLDAFTEVIMDVYHNRIEYPAMKK